MFYPNRPTGSCNYICLEDNTERIPEFVDLASNQTTKQHRRLILTGKLVYPTNSIPSSVMVMRRRL